MGRKAIYLKRLQPERQLRILLTDEQRKKIDAAAAKAGKPTSTWVRDILIRRLGK